jgi:predicted RNA methylase
VSVIHDLGCGTGSMARWLAPQLPGEQRWVLHDRDVELLRIAETGALPSSSDGAAVSVQLRRSDIRRLEHADLAGAR